MKSPPKRVVIYAGAGLVLAAVFYFSGSDDTKTAATPTGPQASPQGNEAFFAVLRKAIESKDERRLKQAVNGLLVPAESRPPGTPSVSTIEEAIALAKNVGVYTGDPGFQLFLKLFREAPTISRDRRGYPDLPEPSPWQ